MPTNDELFEQAEKALDDLFGDMTVSKQETVENMNALIDKAQTLADILQSEIDKEESGDDE